MALGIAAAITAQYIDSFLMAAREGHSLPTTSANFFSFFTVLSNLGALIALLWAAIWWLAVGRRDDRPEPRPLAVTLAGVTTYLLVTGIVYNALLRAIPEPPGAIVPWSNEILHVVAPTFMLLDLLLGPRRRRLVWGTIGGLLVFPLVWIVYTMIRGPLTVSPVTGTTPWYPYPFLYRRRTRPGSSACSATSSSWPCCSPRPRRSSSR